MAPSRDSSTSSDTDGEPPVRRDHGNTPVELEETLHGGLRLLPALHPHPRLRSPSPAATRSTASRGRQQRAHIDHDKVRDSSVDGFGHSNNWPHKVIWGSSGRQINFHLNLLPNDLGLSNKRHVRVETLKNMHPGSEPAKREDIEILASMNYSDDDSSSKVILTYRSTPPNDTEGDQRFLHWRHVTREKMDMDEFQLLALKTPNISEDMKLLVSEMLKKVNATNVKPFCGGLFDEPTAMRYDGRRINYMDRPDLHVTWLSFPYAEMYDHGSFRTNEASPLPLHPPMTLLQTLYNYESTMERDAEQLFPTAQKGNEKKILHISRIWFLICGEEAVLSYGPMSLDNLFATRIFRTPQKRESAKLFKIIDPFRRLFFIPLENCKNFFTFRNIVIDCIKDKSLSFENCTLFCNERSTVLASSNWHEVVGSTKTSIINVEITRGKYMIAAEIPVKEDEPDDEGTSSDEDDLAEKVANHTLTHNMQLMVLDHSQDDHQRRREAKKEEKLRVKVKDLKNDGYIVNGRRTLQKPETVKIFRREPENTGKPSQGTEGSTSNNNNNNNNPTSTERNSSFGIATGPLSSTKTTVEDKPSAATDKIQEETSDIEGANVYSFFSWPLDATEDPRKKTTNSSEDDSSGLNHIMDRVNDKIKHSDFDITSGYPVFGSEHFRQGRFHKHIESSTFQEMSQHWQAQRLSQAGEAKSGEKITAFSWLYSEQRQRLEKIVDEAVASTRGFVSLFAPLTFPHALMNHIWGSVLVLLNAKRSAVPAAFGTASSARDENETVTWKIRHTTNIHETAKKYKLTIPRVPFDECETCQNGEVYKSLEQAVNHLKREHYYQRHEYNSEQLEPLHYWIKSSEHETHEAWTYAQLNMLEVYHDDMKRIYKLGREIRDGVAMSREVGNVNVEKSKPNHIALPTALVRAFRNFTVFLMCTAYSLKLNQDHFTREIALEKGKVAPLPPHDSFLFWIGVRAYFSMEKAYQDVTLMIRTDSSSDTVNYAAVGPRFIISSICDQLARAHFGPDGGKSPVDIYEEIVSNLRYQVYYGRPSRRLMVTVQAAQEELEAMLRLMNQQFETRHDFWRVNNPRWFRITDQWRRQQWQLEAKLDDDFEDALKENLDRLKGLTRRLSQLEVKARHRIEIVDEDHGKAILIFTVITLLFLPLSFVTSYLGMNTADIRDMDNSQTLFWTIAIPVTAMVLGLAALMAYKGDAIRERFLSMNMRQNRAGLPRRSTQSSMRYVRAQDSRKPRMAKPWSRRKGRTYSSDNQAEDI